MESWNEEFKKIIYELDINLSGTNNDNKGVLSTQTTIKDDSKYLKKKIKKYAIEKDDNIQTATNKAKKLLDQIYKNYQIVAKEYSKTLSLKNYVAESKVQKDNSFKQVKSSQFLQKQFQKRVQQTLKDAHEVQKRQENKRKQLIQQLQKRIKQVQEDYQTAGKQKIQKYRENQTLKHEINKLEPQALTTQSLMDAQLKKKQIEIQIQMTTLKQKIQMMNNFKKMSEDTKRKLEIAEITCKKVDKRLVVLQSKEDQNKIVVTRAHLILQQYKKSITKINQLLTKHEKQAIKAEQAVENKKQSMQQIDKKISDLEKEYQGQKSQINILLSLEQALKKQITN